MGCATSSKQSPDQEMKFLEKAQTLLDKYVLLRKEVIKTRHLLYKKFSIRNKIYSSPDSKTTIGSQTHLYAGQILSEKLQQNATQNENPSSPHENEKKEETKMGEQIEDDHNAKQKDQGNAICEEFIFVDSKQEMQYLKEAYNQYVLHHTNPSKITDLCKFFSDQLEKQINSMQSIIKEIDLLNKCLKAYKKGSTNKQSITMIEETEKTNAELKKYLEQVSSTKHNIQELALMTLIPNPTNSVFNSVDINK